jgi:hypothetical protein
MAGKVTEPKLRLACVGALIALGCSEPPAPLQPRPIGNVELAQRVSAAYAGWTANDALSANCSVYFSACAETFMRKSGADPQDLAGQNPRAFMTNPDAEWLPGWDQLPADSATRHLTYGALTYAASMKAYFGSCRATAKEGEDRRRAAAQLLATERAAAEKEPNVYKRLGGLVRVRQELRKRFPDPVGPRYDVELLLRDAFISAGRELVYDLRRQRPDDIGALRPTLASAEESDLFCMDGMPTWQDPESVPYRFVKVAVNPGRNDALLAKVKALQDLESKIPLREPVIPGIDERTVPADAPRAFDKAVLNAPLFVKKVSDAEGGGLLVELAGKATVQGARYDCKESDKPEKVGPDGKIAYPLSCKTRNEARKITVVVRMAERPDITIQLEDQVTFIGKLTKLTQKTSGKTSPVSVQYDVEVEALHVLEIWRQQLLVADYFVQ